MPAYRRWGIASVSGECGGMGRFNRMHGRGEIRFAGGKPNNINTLRGEIPRLLRHRNGR
ncbi:hypothetical protein HAT93_03484 [Dickeya solani]|nr:hypothetical protein [Dickeya solani]QKO13388.1 hypothetical protein HAT91_01746 [Dickeya solani]